MTQPSPDFYRPHGSTVYGLYAPQTGDADFGAVHIHSRLAQYVVGNMMKVNMRLYIVPGEGFYEVQDAEVPTQENSYHGLIGVPTQQGVQNLHASIEPDNLFPITDGPAEDGLALIGFFYEAEDVVTQTWKVVVRNGTGTTVIDTGVLYPIGQRINEWCEMRIVRSSQGNLHFYIKRAHDREVKITINADNPNIPVIDAHDIPFYLGKIHYTRPLAITDGETTISAQRLEFVDYNVSKFRNSFGDAYEDLLGAPVILSEE